MRVSSVVLSLSATAAAVAPPSADALKASAKTFAAELRNSFPDHNQALLPPPSSWWESGVAVNGFLTYSIALGDKQYNSLAANTLNWQSQSGHDFDSVAAGGNDDQAWWALASLTASEINVPQVGPVSWFDMAHNAFNEQKGRWDMTRCGGGLKWKISPSADGYHYKTSIANGLFFQLAARIAADKNDADALAWAEKTYDWVVKVGLIDKDYNVYDGTDDAKGTGCVDVNHDQWSYNVAVYTFGAATMAAHTKDPKWTERTKGLIASAKRTFVNPKTGALFEQKCELANNCDSDQVSFKGILAKWLGATAVALPEVKAQVADIINGAATVVQNGPKTGLNPIQSYTAMEIVDACLRTMGVAKRSIAGRIML